MHMSRANRVKKIDPFLLPHSSRAVQLYEQRGGRIREISQFGRNPIADDAIKCDQRKQAFTHLLKLYFLWKLSPFQKSIKVLYLSACYELIFLYSFLCLSRLLHDIV